MSPRRGAARARRRGRNERGGATLGIVLCVPALLGLVMTVAQFVVYYHASHLAAAAAQEGVRAAQGLDGTAEAAQAQAADFLAQAGPSLVLGPVVEATRDPDTARVEVRARAPQLVPGLSLTIRAVASGPVERFIGDAGP